jgi:hypothetical protein
MDRISSEIIDQSRVDYWRDYHHNASASEDTELDPLDRRDRTDVIVPSYLKRSDDVQIAPLGDIHARIVGPGSGRTMAMIYYPQWFGDQPIDVQLLPTDITDRAPADAQEAAMPCWPVEP